MFTLEEDKSFEYPSRTEKNIVASDVTIAIAIDFNSAGEKLTKKLTLQHGKKYIAVNPFGDIKEKSEKIINVLNTLECQEELKGLRINVAGNGIYTLKNKIDQEECDNFTYELFSNIIYNKNFKNKIISLRSGGQTGFDEAGAKAGIELKIPTTVLMPKNFRIRTLKGDETMSKEDAKKRFIST